MRPCICFHNPNCPFCEGSGFVGLPPREDEPEPRDDVDRADGEIADHLSRQEFLNRLLEEGRSEQQRSIRSAVLAHSNAEFSERISEQMDEAVEHLTDCIRNA